MLPPLANIKGGQAMIDHRSRRGAKKERVSIVWKQPEPRQQTTTLPIHLSILLSNRWQANEPSQGHADKKKKKRNRDRMKRSRRGIRIQPSQDRTRRMRKDNAQARLSERVQGRRDHRWKKVDMLLKSKETYQGQP
jgi:hypothetical protein